jgi:tetratricopeptide (TPR) repeat protein
VFFSWRPSIGIWITISKTDHSSSRNRKKTNKAPVWQFPPEPDMGILCEQTDHRAVLGIRITSLNGEGMKSQSFAALLLVAAGLVSCLGAQQSSLDVLTRAAALNAEGKFRAAFELVQPLLEPHTQKLDTTVTGVAWNIRGLALQNMGNLDEARRSYESAIQILRALPDQKIQHANALDNLGSLEADNGQLNESKVLRIRAMELYESAGDHAGVARVASSLAVVELALGSRRRARGYMADAYREEAQVATPDPRNLAWMFGAECLLNEADGKFQAGLDRINRVIDLWTQHYGSNYYLLASAYSIRGRLYHVLGDDTRAVEDMKHSLALLSDNNEENSKLYFFVEIMYAKVLKNSGKKDDASRMESNARTALERLRHRECSGCTISAEGIR